MTRTTPALFSIALMLTVPCKAVTLGQYILTDLGDLPGGTDESYATGINSNGQVVGWSGTDTVTRGFLWSPNAPNSSAGTLTDIGSLRPDGQSYAFGINSRGQIAGRTSTDQSNAAFIWTPTTPNGATGSMVPIGGNPFEEGFNIAYGLNSYGQIAGDGETPGGARSFLWTPSTANGGSGSITDLAVTLPVQNPAGYGINSYGQVVSGVRKINGLSNGFVWSPDSANGTTGSVVLLTSAPSIFGQFDTDARAIAADGRIVGSSGVAVIQSNGNASFTYDAAMWVPTTPNGTSFSIVDLGSIGPLGSDAYAINSHGVVVGHYEYDLNYGRAFIWTPDVENGTHGAMIDLNQFLTSSDQAHWTLYRATAINDFGQIIGNALFDPDGPGGAPAIQRAFLLTPVPEPSTITMIGVLIMGLASSRGKHHRDGRLESR